MRARKNSPSSWRSVPHHQPARMVDAMVTPPKVCSASIRTPAERAKGGWPASERLTAQVACRRRWPGSCTRPERGRAQGRCTQSRPWGHFWVRESRVCVLAIEAPHTSDAFEGQWSPQRRVRVRRGRRGRSEIAPGPLSTADRAPGWRRRRSRGDLHTESGRAVDEGVARVASSTPSSLVPCDSPRRLSLAAVTLPPCASES